jgi:hypothetical protein
VVGLLVVAGLLFAWNRMLSPEQAPAVATPVPQEREAGLAEALSAMERRQASLDRRLEVLERNRQSGAPVTYTSPEYNDLSARLEAVEIQLRRLPDDADLAGSPGNENSQGVTLYSPGESDSQVEQLEQAFEQDASVDGAEQASLENAATIFDREELSDLQFRDLVCRETYCKLSYEDHSSSAGASTIAENELFMALLEKYGDGVAIHGGEQAGRNRTFYIERNVSR